MVHADEKPSTPPAELDAEETQSSDQSFRGQLYWILPIVIATLSVTLWLLLNPRWGGEVAAIVTAAMEVGGRVEPGRGVVRGRRERVGRRRSTGKSRLDGREPQRPVSDAESTGPPESRTRRITCQGS